MPERLGLTSSYRAKCAVSARPHGLDTASPLPQRPRPLGAATYQRVVSIDRGPVGLSVIQDGAPDAPRLSVRLAGGPIDQHSGELARSSLNRLLGLTVDLSGFATMAARDPLLGPLAAHMRGLRPPRFPTVFEALVNGVACQQLSLSVGIHLLNRLVAAYGKPVSENEDGRRAFPTPEELATVQPDELKRHGFSLTKARTIVETARAIVAGDLDLEGLEDVDNRAAIERLKSLRGVGRWTAEYVMLRGFGRLDIFPGDDVGAQQAQALLRHRHRTRLRRRQTTGCPVAPLRRRRLLPSVA